MYRMTDREGGDVFFWDSTHTGYRWEFAICREIDPDLIESIYEAIAEARVDVHAGDARTMAKIARCVRRIRHPRRPRVVVDDARGRP